MTDELRCTRPSDCGGDAAAYVLGALEPLEVDAFRAHLAGCIVCRDEVAALQQVADALPMAAPPRPPRGACAGACCVRRERSRAPLPPPARRARAPPRPALGGDAARGPVIGGGVELATTEGERHARSRRA